MTMRNFSVRCKAKYLLATLALVFACDGDDPGPDDGGDESTGDTGDTGDTGETSGPALDMMPDDTCPSLCPETTTLECGDGERCELQLGAPVPECRPCP